MRVSSCGGGGRRKAPHQDAGLRHLLPQQRTTCFNDPLMESILREIESTIAAGLWYAAIALCLTLPDICATLEARSGARSDGQQARYNGWFNRNVAAKFGLIGLSAEECWKLRCGVLHEGRYKKRKVSAEYDRIVFTLPPGGTIHNVVIEASNSAILSLSAEFFCNQLIAAVREWSKAKKSDKIVKANLAQLIQPRPNEFEPTVKGPIIIG